MISVIALSAAAQIEVEFTGGVVESVYIVDEPQSVFPPGLNGLNELMSMVEQMQRAQQQPYQNPCTDVSALSEKHGQTAASPSPAHALTLTWPLTLA